MSDEGSASPPNERLRALVDILGNEETRELVRLYLSSVPRLLADIGGADRERSRRAAHSLKSSSQQMGIADLAEQAQAIEKRMLGGGAAPSAIEISLLRARLKRAETHLRPYAGPAATS